MTTHLDRLQTDHQTITQIIQIHRDTPADGHGVGVSTLMNIYLHILEDALTTLNSLIQFLAKRSA
jgi:hypothetical protein